MKCDIFLIYKLILKIITFWNIKIMLYFIFLLVYNLLIILLVRVLKIINSENNKKLRAKAKTNYTFFNLFFS